VKSRSYRRSERTDSRRCIECSRCSEFSEGSAEPSGCLARNVLLHSVVVGDPRVFGNIPRFVHHYL